MFVWGKLRLFMRSFDNTARNQLQDLFLNFAHPWYFKFKNNSVEMFHMSTALFWKSKGRRENHQRTLLPHNFGFELLKTVGGTPALSCTSNSFILSLLAKKTVTSQLAMIPTLLWTSLQDLQTAWSLLRLATTQDVAPQHTEVVRVRSAEWPCGNSSSLWERSYMPPHPQMKTKHF